MQTTTLKLAEIYSLEGELFGVTIQDKVLFKGILGQSLNIKSRYWLSKLGEIVSAEKSSIDKLRDELIKELGTQDEAGNFSLEPKIDGEDNPNFIKFQEQLSSLLNETKEINHAVFTLEQFENLETTEHYPVFFKLLTVEETM